ncbi:MAG TPA: hypothetical protein VLK32_00270 [Bacillota bacterium]|nr:hypothetical protein [Bacillota bacterium]
MSIDKRHRMRIRVQDGKPRDANKVKGQLVPHVDVIDVGGRVEFVIRAVKIEHLQEVRGKLAAAGLEEISGGDTAVSKPAQRVPVTQGRALRGGGTQQPNRPQQGEADPIRSKPYAFVALPETFSTAEPVWHDGTCSEGRLCGEIRFEIENLTPLLVGWERRAIGDSAEAWAVIHTSVQDPDAQRFVKRAAEQVHPDSENPQRQSRVTKLREEYMKGKQASVVEITVAGLTIKSKSVICPLRVPWDERPVIIPGDSLKGMLRHELGALLGAPMERVEERNYSYRPNSLYPNEILNRRLIPRIARIPEEGVELQPLDPDDPLRKVRVPVRLDLLPDDLRFDRDHRLDPPRYRFDAPEGAPYRGGLGAGDKLNSKRRLRSSLHADPSTLVTRVPVSPEVQEGYRNTIRHLADTKHGHFSKRHPDVPGSVNGEQAERRMLDAAERKVFQPGDLIWVEWDTGEKKVVSFGWHYYYRWAYQDSVLRKGGKDERPGLFSLDEERKRNGDRPSALSPVRRLFGYSGDSEGSRGIGTGDYEQLMGRISVNAALEDVAVGAPEQERFLPPVFLKELGMPRPSAVEFYLQQPYPGQRPSDQATLVTYGDAAGYDQPGKLAGRKFYLDRADAYTGEPWKDESEANRLNDRSTLAFDASKPGRRFRFTVRFRDLDADEVAAVLVAFCPDQFAAEVGGAHSAGYCSKLGYARPLGWGSVRIVAKEMHLLEWSEQAPKLELVIDLIAWFRNHFKKSSSLSKWLDIHRCKHPDAADYPRKDGQIYTFHADLRSRHTRSRRYATNPRETP